jgi:hypothetical protein
MHTHSILMSTSDRLGRLDLEIHEVGHKSVSLSTGKLLTTKKIVSHKYNTHVKFIFCL